MRWKGTWPEPEDNDDGWKDADGSVPAEKQNKIKKKTPQEDAPDMADADEKPKKKRRSNAAEKAEEPGETEAEENATFARRYRPARALESARWVALRDAFQKHVKPRVDSPSSVEAWSCDI